ncbi:MAG TPA: SUMF1/EgtB/PvdO family nonheme iron enzyme [Bacteroidota bacterium]|nr:SUMF1/EgtB/PvdO family nonheme iron enzyme [Bacteroidota bacterium]
MRIFSISVLLALFALESVGQNMVKVDGGTFAMGSADEWDYASPVHSVTVGSFFIEKFEVTFELWEQVRSWGASHSYTDLPTGQNGVNPVGGSNPVTKVRWYEIIKWCNARSEMEGFSPVYYRDSLLTKILRTGVPDFRADRITLANTANWSANGYRLPTEAEWEFAARGGKKSLGYLYSGGNIPDVVGWYIKGSGSTWTRATHSVGQKAPNELGLYDMTGNVDEECYDIDGPYTGEAQINPIGALSGGYRSVRGGGVDWPALHLAARRTIHHAGGSDYTGFRCVRAPRIMILKPAFREVVPANSSYYIKWKSIGVDSIKIEYSLDNGKSYAIIANSVPAVADSFKWNTPDTLSSKCMMKMTEIDNQFDTVVNTNFRIKGYILTRFKPNGDYDKFDPALHAWPFTNDSSYMWPHSWRSQFNYSQNDPYTGRPYPSYFRAAPIRAKQTNFIDWPLFVRTFNPSLCYKNIAEGKYSPTAVRLWAKFKNPTFIGSCFGFSQSCLLAFDRPEEFRQAYPAVGNVTYIRDRQLDDSVRLVINQLYEHQFGRQHMQFQLTQCNPKNVRETLAELKSYFLSDTIDHRSLGFCCFQGGHSVVPFKLEKSNSDPGIFNLRVYDNNAPSGVSDNKYATVMRIDSVNNEWTYMPLLWQRTDGWGIYLRDPASTYLRLPELWNTASPPHPASAPAEGTQASAAASSIEIYNSGSSAISIYNRAGRQIGFRDSVSYNTIDDGMAIIPVTGNYQPPIGYMIPDDGYAVSMSAFTDSLADFSVLNSTGMFSCWRSDAVKSQTDMVTYDGGLGFSNRDAQSKSVNLESITRLTASERQCQILNCTTVQNDSIKLAAPDSDRVILINYGPAKTYDLNIVLSGASSSGQFVSGRMTVPAHSTHYIVPDWRDLRNQSVKIYQDTGNKGTISDSLVAVNQLTGIQDQSTHAVPDRFYLAQNYPNPFNSSSTIRYGLPKASHVRLTIYNLLGQNIGTLVDEEQAAGTHTAIVNMTSYASGVYFYTLQADAYSETKKLILLR